MKKINYLKKFFLVSVLLVSWLFSEAQPHFVEGTWFSGSYNNNIGTLNDRGSHRYFRAATTASGNQSLLLNNSGDNYNPKWVADNSTPYAVNTIHSNGSRYYTSGGSDLMFSVTNGRYYTIIVGENSSTNNNLSILETSYNPVTISSVSQSPTTVYATQSVTVTATMPSALNSGEGAYLRYSTDGFGSSTIVAMTNSSGFNYEATIPAQTNGVAVQYYVFTSNISSSTVTGNPANADFYSLNIRTFGGLNLGGSNYTYTVQQWQTVPSATNWSSGSSWNAGSVPPSGVNVNIAHNLTLDQDATVGALTISGGAVLAGGTNILSITGDVTMTSGSISSSGVGRVEFTGTATQTIGAGTFGNMRCNKTSGTVNIAAVTCSGLEITSGTMQLTGASAFTVNGDVLINGGTFALSSTSGGDLSLTGNWTRSSGTFTPNNRAIFFTGTNNQTINGSGGASIPYMLINKSSGTVSLGSNLSLTAPLGGNALDIGGPTLDLNGFNLSITNNINVSGSSVNRSITNTGAAATITTSSTTISRGSTATLSIGTNITLETSNGINFGAGITTVNGTFRINAGGFISTNSPTWGIGSTYNLNTGGTYDINSGTLGWTSSITPTNILVSNSGTIMNINQNRNVSASGTMVIEAGCVITIGSGAILTTNGNLTLRSNSTGTASIGNSAGSISGNVTVERYIPRRRAFRFLASPVNTSNFISGSWQQATHITGSTSGANGFDSTASGTASLFTYNAGSEAWAAIPNTNSTNLNIGTGYRMLVRGDRNINLYTSVQDSAALVLSATGSIVTGNVVFGAGSVSSSPAGIPALNAAVGSGANESTTGWSLIGNPYACAVSWANVTKSNVSTSFATWNVNNAGRGSYVYHTGSVATGNGASNIINSGQSIFVQTTGANPSITFTEASKVTSTPPSHFKKSLSYVLNIDIFIGDRAYDGLTVLFNENNSNEYDVQDFIKLVNPEINFYSYLADGTKLAMNNMKEIASETIVPLGLTGVFNGGSYELKFTNQNTFTNSEVYLKDKFINKTYDLKSINNLTFNVTADSNSFGENRFELIFSKSATGLNNELSSNNNNFIVFPNPANNVLNLSLTTTKEDNYNFTIYNQLGAEVNAGSLDFNAKRTHALNIENLSNGVYFIQVKNGKTAQTIKFIK